MASLIVIGVSLDKIVSEGPNAKMPNPSPSERGARIGHFWPPLMVLKVSILVYTAIALGAVQRLFQTHGSD
jgi:hypothetical protein